MTLQNRTHFRSLSAALGLVLALPVTLFVAFNVLKYELGLLPGIEIPPLHPLLLLGSALGALLLNAWTVLDLRLERQDDTVWLMFGLVNRPWNWAVLILAGLFLSLLLGYVFVENAAAVLGI
jgi:hypothetical protein